MRIAAVTSYFPNSEQPYRGHSAYQTLRCMTDLANVRVFCPLARYPDWLQPRNFPYRRADLSYTVPDLATEYLEYPAAPVLSRPFNPWTCRNRLLKRVAAFDPDVILNYFVYPEGCASLSIGRELNAPVILGVIGSDVNRIPDVVTGWHTRRALRRASGVITVSRQLSDRAVKLGAHQSAVTTIANGCDTGVFHARDREAARAQLGLPRSMQLVLFVGWLAPTKGVRELLQAAEQLASTHPKLHIAFVGEGVLAADVKAAATDGAIAGRVFAPGIQSSSSVAVWMAAADVFCLPSYAEGCPNVVLEALACGRPVVASRVGAIPELVNERSGILVSPCDSASLAVALDSALARDWNGREIAAQSNRSWRSVAEETLAVCDAAVRRP